MKSLWNDAEAAKFTTPLAQRVYTSRLLGQDASLVLHGGGNTSVKITEKNLFGEDEELLYVKGSGWDLVSIEEAGFTPVRLKPVARLGRLENLSDPQMVNELRAHTTRASAPAPSVETILHALLPYTFVDHTHADAVLTITNTADGEARIRELYGDSVVIIPYVMPGFDLARLCAQRFPLHVTPRTIGMVLLNHGIFSFGANARESYERMIKLVDAAEQYIARQKAWSLPSRAPAATNATGPQLASLRREASRAAGFPLVMRTARDERVRAFLARTDLDKVTQQGPATPDHVIRTKQLPMVGTDVERFVSAYKTYFDKHAASAKEPKTMLDPAPRMMVDPAYGFCSFGRSAKDCGIVEDLYRHTMDVIERSTALGGYQALPARDIFDVEYWDLEQAKLKLAGAAPMLAGEVALVTGAASGIGAACVASLLKRGAAVVGLDINEAVKTVQKGPGYTGIVCDVTSAAQLAKALDQAIVAYGGVDMVVVNAGIFPATTKIAELTDEMWRKVMAVNLDSSFSLLRETHPYLKLSPRGGRVVVIGSKNVPAPGPGAAAYSASKAALTQLARVAALEWGGDGIRINLLHPNAVFDTGIWSEEVLATRAKHYGMSVDEYKRNNVLHTDVTSKDVAELAAEMCGPLFARTTGAQVPIDGGNERVI